MNTTFIGDAHGMFDRYENIIRSVKNTIQVGDMGVGFRIPIQPNVQLMEEQGARWIRGNHDAPHVCRDNPHWIEDGTTEVTDAGTKMMFVGGAWSIDFMMRQKNVNWWEDEECSYAEFQRFIDQYMQFKPDVMVTHDAPESVIKHLFLNGTHKPRYRSLTGSALDAMFEMYRPKLWVFGHWHVSVDSVVHGTRFRCVAELETFEVDL